MKHLRVNSMITSFACKLALGSLLVAANAIAIQSDSQTDESIAITGAQIHTASSQGIIQSGTVLIENGKIREVTSGKSVPSGFKEIDATGKVVTPGFIGARTSLGLVEVSMSAGVNDSRTDSHDVSTTGAAYDVSFAINPDSTLIDITRIEGFTAAASGLGGTGQLFDGQGAVISLDKSADSVLKSKAFVHVDIGNGGADRNGESRVAMWVALNQSLSEADFAKGLELSPTQEWHGVTSRADAKVLSEVLSGNIPLLITAHRVSDIRQALAIKERYANVDLVLVHASDAWRIADELAKADVPVIINPEANLPGQFDRLASTLKNAGRLHKAGVRVSIGIDTHNIRLASQHAGNAVANGLPHRAAIEALTINPARIYGVDDMIGSLEAGKRADVVIWSGDPLEVTEAAEQVFINGKAMSMESRQTKLRDRYMNRQIDKPVSYSN